MDVDADAGELGGEIEPLAILFSPPSKTSVSTIIDQSEDVSNTNLLLISPMIWQSNPY
jgi:hypothetical protein